MKSTLALRGFLLGSILFSASPVLHAITYYWDDNAAGTDFGMAGASTGNWAGPTAGPTAGWSLSGTGANAFAAFTTGTADALNFGTNTVGLGLGAGTINVSGAVSANSITYGSQSGAIEISGGTSITLGGTTPTITVNNAQNTISTKIINSTAGNNSGLIKSGTGELILSGTGNSIAGDATAAANGVAIRVSAGTLTVSGGSLTTATASKGIGSFSADSGVFNQTGGTVSATGDLIVGWNSSPTFTLSGGLTSAANLRHQDGGNGVVNISGTNTTTVGAVTHTTSGSSTDSLTVNLNTGGTLAANSMGLSLSGSATSSGNHSLNVNFDGGTLKARSTANLIAATPVATSTRAINVIVKANGAVFDSNGFTATILQPVLHDSALGASPDGGLTLNDTALAKGTLVLTGVNTYTGATTITTGTLQFSKQTTLYGNDTTSWTAANLKVAGTLALNVGGAGEFTTGDVTTLLTNLGGANGTSTTGFAAGSTIAFDTTTAAGGTFTIADIIANSTGTGGGAIGLKKLGINTLVLSGPNTYTGATTVSGGTLVLSNTGVIANSASVSVASGTTLQANAAGTYANTAAVSLVGNGINTLAANNAGALHFTGGTAVWNAPLTLGAATTRVTSFAAVSNMTLGAAIGGTGPLELSSRAGDSVNHVATWTLGVASNYSGNTSIINNDGLKDITVKLGVASALPATTSLNLQATKGVGTNTVFATLDLNGFPQTLAGLTDTGGTVAAGLGSKRVINSSGTPATLTINNAGPVTYGTTGTRITAGTIGGTTAAGAAANNLALTKNNVGILTLNGTNTYTGQTIISGGTLALGLNGSITSSASVSISAGTALDTSAKATYAIPAAQPVEFAIDGAGSGSSGKIVAAGLNVSNATVTYNITGPLDDAVYVLASYTGTLTGTFVSVPAAPAGYSLNYAYEGNKIALIQTGGANYLSWASANSVTGGPGGDHDNDGVKNLVEYALIDGGERGTFSGNTITYNKRLAPYGTDVSHDIEISTDLGIADSWETAVSGVTEDSTKIEYTFTPGTPVRNFARLKVVTIP